MKHLRSLRVEAFPQFSPASNFHKIQRRSHCCPLQINKFVLVLAFSATSASVKIVPLLRRKQPRPAAGCRPLEKVGQREFTMYTCPPSIFSRSYFLSRILSLSLFLPSVGQSRRYFPVLYRSPFSSIHALSPHPSLSSFSCDFPFYSSSFCTSPVACRSPVVKVASAFLAGNSTKNLDAILRPQKLKITLLYSVVIPDIKYFVNWFALQFFVKCF